MKKRILAILLTISMLMSMLPVGVLATDVVESAAEEAEVYAAETEPEAAAEETLVQSEDDDQIVTLASVEAKIGRAHV